MQDVYQTGGFPPVIQAMQHFQERGAQERSGERGGRAFWKKYGLEHINTAVFFMAPLFFQQ